MLAYAIRRLLQFIPTILGVTLIVFLLLNVLPGNAVLTALAESDRGLDQKYVESMKQLWGLDKPLHMRYADYMSKLAQGDLGRSFLRRDPVNRLVLERHSPRFLLGAPPGVLAGHDLHGGRRIRRLDAPVLAGAAPDVRPGRGRAPLAHLGLR
jgi:peptide/nickel transport system permease protein